MRVLSLANSFLSNELIQTGAPLGVTVCAFPALQYKPNQSTIDALENETAFDVLMITSRIAAQLLPLSIMNRAPVIVAVGNSTESMIRTRDIHTPIRVPPSPSMRGIQTHLVGDLVRKKILYPRSSNAIVAESWFTDLPSTLISPILYHPVPVNIDDIQPDRFDWIIVSSGQIAYHLFTSFPNLSVPIVCIGPETERALPPKTPRIVSPSPAATDILSCIIDFRYP